MLIPNMPSSAQEGVPAAVGVVTDEYIGYIIPISKTQEGVPAAVGVVT